jgi:cytoplasmic iron level regulating protein YaaA (DUF328/UPF0246 family)
MNCPRAGPARCHTGLGRYTKEAMLALLSPAKTLDFEALRTPVKASSPALLEQSEELVGLARNLTGPDLMKLMKISKGLATLNVRRFKEFQTPFTEQNAKPAIFAFKGDTYVGFDVEELDAEALAYAQRHVRILSGLYGLLRPLDLIQPYRLEMGIKLANPRGKDLYAFWGDRITEAINASLENERDALVVNLASNEYIKSVKPEKLSARFVHCVFKEVRGGHAKVVGLSAKRARGMMARFICQRRVGDVEGLRGFDEAGYRFQAKHSTDQVLEFHRES